ncbi:MAG: threonine/serine exporter family protein [Clostridiales bacterium]|nr:threonine/serine exporter family protein [Clostridiales bacterium]
MRELCEKMDAVCLAAQIILESGGETYRSEETAEKMCQGFGIEKMDVLAMPTGVTMTVQSEDGESMTRIVRVRQRAINLARIDACNCVSRKVAAGKMNAEEAYRTLEAIRTSPPFPQSMMLVACALSSGFFAVMLGGMWIDFAVACVCGLVTQALLPCLHKRRVPTVLTGMISGFFTALIALLSRAYFPQINIEAVISGAIMPVLPGMAMTSAIRDTIRGDLVSGGARSVEAVLSAVLIAAGVGIMMSLWGGVFG